MLRAPCYILMTAQFLLTVERTSAGFDLAHRCLLRLWLPPGDALRRSVPFSPFIFPLRFSQHSVRVDRYRNVYIHTPSLFSKGYGRFFVHQQVFEAFNGFAAQKSGRNIGGF